MQIRSMLREVNLDQASDAVRSRNAKSAFGSGVDTGRLMTPLASIFINGGDGAYLLGLDETACLLQLGVAVAIQGKTYVRSDA